MCRKILSFTGILGLTALLFCTSCAQANKDSPDEKPFMVFYGFTHPHDPRHGKDDLLQKYGAVNENRPDISTPNAPPLPANYLPVHPFFISIQRH